MKRCLLSSVHSSFLVPDCTRLCKLTADRGRAQRSTAHFLRAGAARVLVLNTLRWQMGRSVVQGQKHRLCGPTERGWNAASLIRKLRDVK